VHCDDVESIKPFHLTCIVPNRSAFTPESEAYIEVDSGSSHPLISRPRKVGRLTGTVGVDAFVTHFLVAGGTLIDRSILRTRAMRAWLWLRRLNFSHDNWVDRSVPRGIELSQIFSTMSPAGKG
jgi:hypothetical protein